MQPADEEAGAVGPIREMPMRPIGSGSELKRLIASPGAEAGAEAGKKREADLTRLLTRLSWGLAAVLVVLIILIILTSAALMTMSHSVETTLTYLVSHVSPGSIGHVMQNAELASLDVVKMTHELSSSMHLVSESVNQSAVLLTQANTIAARLVAKPSISVGITGA